MSNQEQNEGPGFRNVPDKFPEGLIVVGVGASAGGLEALTVMRRDLLP
jgi:chemotaxis response regulator CheB